LDSPPLGFLSGLLEEPLGFLVGFLVAPLYVAVLLVGDPFGAGLSFGGVVEEPPISASRSEQAHWR